MMDGVVWTKSMSHMTYGAARCSWYGAHMADAPTVYTTRIRGDVVAHSDTLRQASIAREILWVTIASGRHPNYGADDFRDRAHFIGSTTITNS